MERPVLHFVARRFTLVLCVATLLATLGAIELFDRWEGAERETRVAQDALESARSLAKELVPVEADPDVIAERVRVWSLSNPSVVGVIHDRVQVIAGQSVQRRYSFKESGRLRLLVRPWADVTVDGRHAGQTPMEALRLPPGRHTIVMRHPELGEKSAVVEVFQDRETVLEVLVDPRRPLTAPGERRPRSPRLRDPIARGHPHCPFRKPGWSSRWPWTCAIVPSDLESATRRIARAGGA